MAEDDVAEVDVLVVGGTFREVIEQPIAPPDVRLGGSAVIAAVAAARMGVSVAVSTFVGAEDEDAVRTLLSHAGVEADIVLLPGASGTFVYPVGSVDTNPRPLYRPAEASPGSLPPLRPAAALLIFGMPDFDPPRDLAVIAAARRARTVVWDRQGWLSRTRDASPISDLQVPHCVLISNVDEAIDEGVVDQDTGKVKLPPGFDAAILKDGKRGAMINQADRRIAIPAYPVDVPNNVGSGDIFAGVVVAEVSRGATLEQAASLAAAATSAVLATQDTLAPPDLRELALEVMRTAESTRVFDWRWQSETGG